MKDEQQEDRGRPVATTGAAANTTAEEYFDSRAQEDSPEMAVLITLRALQRCGETFTIHPKVTLEKLREQGDAAARGDLAQVRRTLAAQVTLLDHLTHQLLARAAYGCKVADLFERFTRLALRTQAQCARTATVLERMCRTSAATKEGARAVGAATTTEVVTTEAGGVAAARVIDLGEAGASNDWATQQQEQQQHHQHLRRVQGSEPDASPEAVVAVDERVPGVVGRAAGRMAGMLEGLRLVPRSSA